MPLLPSQSPDLEAGNFATTISSPTLEKSEFGMSPATTASTSKPWLPSHTLPHGKLSLKNWWTRLKSWWLCLVSWFSQFALMSLSRSGKETTIPTVRKLDDCPRGYPLVAAFLDSDESFAMYRRFGFLQSRLLLDKQDELRELEEALDRLDRRETQAGARRPMTRDLPDDQLESRKKLLAMIEEKFCAYANLLKAAQKMMSLNRPGKGDYQSLLNFMDNRKPLAQTEAKWVLAKEDLITLRAGREHAWLDVAIEKILKLFHCALLEQLFGDERSRQKSSGDEVYYSREQISRIANCILTFIILVLLVVPIYALYHLINDVHSGEVYAICMGILLVSTLAFSAVLSLFTRAKRHEILAAAATYAAVLVVFFGNVGPGFH